MNVKLIGAIVVILACWGIGCTMTVSYNAEIRAIHNLINAIRYMRSELEYRCIALPELCSCAAQITQGCVSKFLSNLSKALDSQICPDARQCTLYALSRCDNMPDSVRVMLTDFGKTLGIFDLSGQLAGLEHVSLKADEILKLRLMKKEIRTRTYQTLGLCFGATLVILLI